MSKMTWPRAVGFLVLYVLCAGLPPTSGYVRNRRNPPAEPVLQFRLTQITKQTTSSGHQVQLHLEGPKIPQVVLIRGLMRGRSVETLPVGQDGVAQFNVSNDSYPREILVMFLHPRGYHSLALAVDEHSPSVENVPDMTLLIQEGPEVTFREGSDVDLNVSFTMDSDQNITQSPGVYFRMDVMSQEEGGSIKRYFADESSSPLQIMDQGQSQNSVFAHLRIHTSSGKEGVLQVVLHNLISYEANSMLQAYFIGHDVPVYREDHDGPFPEHFIGSIPSSGVPDESFEFCYEGGYPCFIHCDLIGDQPSAVEIVRVLPSGKLVATDYISISNHGFRALGQLFLANATSEDSGTYQCRSRSGSVEFVHTVNLIVGQDARIVDTSTTTTSEDGTIETTCLATGDPAPSFTIKDSNGDPVTPVAGELEVSTVVLNDTTSQAVVRITDPTLAAQMQYLTCEAENWLHGRKFTDTRRLYMNPEDQEMSYMARYYLHNVVGEEDL